jgi:hypothetical protein
MQSLESGRFGRALILMMAVAVFLAAVGCGGGTSAPPGGGGGGGGGNGTTAAQVKIGDAPADRVIAFEVTVGPITMTPSSGSAVTVLSTTRRLELTHLTGTNEPGPAQGSPRYLQQRDSDGCQLAPHHRPHHPVLVHRLAPLIRASFRPPPRDDALALLQPFTSSTRSGRGLSPPSCRTCSAQKKRAASAAPTSSS